MAEIVVAAFYKFTPLPDYAEDQPGLLACAEGHGVKGTILLAAEGVNGTIAGSRNGVDAVLGALKALPGCADLDWKESYTDDNPFLRMKVRLKKEIVTLGVGDVEPHKSHERYVEPHDWNKVISDPDTIVIDTRNDYEVGIGAFEGAIDPKTASFRDFAAWFRKFREENQFKKVAMYCTGGIRCEKSVAFLRSEGVEDVVHLKGGILKYLETVPEEESLWRGECFVFDSRVSVGHDLAPGSYDQCFACRRPITEEDKASLHYVAGISCPHCVDEYSEERRRAFAERQKQIQLAKARGEQHLGVKMVSRTDHPRESGDPE
ncbi:oxygen-dependent tRNA uridine(34) hydroxylase TrhO [Hyphococcus sp.]|uniref:oxygen-dependent tRNA uridine(34) hydroxylase TrhO n=1 Tax=Hyphococcus sp. TaxID=2038636 RepID=UPI0035C6CC05